MKQANNPQVLRDKYIRELARADNHTTRAKELADDLFALDLTVYSQNFSFNSVVFNSFAISEIDEGISLHPEQMQIILHITNHLATIISAPTSFGKTFCIFEYIVRYRPQNVVLIVPTLALVDEYFKKIIKKYRHKFFNYKVHTGINEDKTYNFNSYNIFILTHDRIVHETAYQKIEKIDFLVIDEVYKLETDKMNARVLVLNMAYYYLSKKAERYVLLAPFIKEVHDTEKLEKAPVFYNSTYSPVVNDVKVCPIINEGDRFTECRRLLNQLNPLDKTLIYFPTVSRMYKYITDVISLEEPLTSLNSNIQFFIEWAKEEIHEEWCLITALERGCLIHNGQIPVGTRMFQLDYYQQNENYNVMLCTSTLLEGVNTTAKNIIITKPSRQSNNPGNSFSAFDFFNLVGRTGRLYQHFIGDAYYIKSPNDPEFHKTDAIKSIRFEITDVSKDIDIQKGNIEGHPDVLKFLELLNITKEEYLEFIGTKTRFDTVLELYERYCKNKDNLLKKLQFIMLSSKPARHPLIKVLDSICESRTNNLRVNLITSLLNKQRPRIKKVVDDARMYFKNDINYLISEAIKMKTSYIEHTFYNKVSIIRFFLMKDNVENELIDVLDDRVLETIEYLYFSNIKHKKMLLDLGIYERDVDKVIKIIGDDFDDAFELKQRLTDNFLRLKGISYLSTYVINNII
ncbi:DEAD/DEAH box helicase [Phosphitispora fastidiosa]|uniref:DEAD/DEAH box helicase n=1 Tax=Phosphitispora fastidiosa TaxID=2837202 RepID=UPI001E5D4118|nr:DEAD/DEAH box helicase [Phosphitispora fastidiosa]MBU7005208.1 hypothetical protein [Phosphitispora fastidiosa]